MRSKKLFLMAGLSVVLSLMVGLESVVYSQDKYPSKAITWIVPFGPGGASDLCFRTVLEDLKAILKVPINVVNKPGAGGLTGADAVAFSKPDGYTLLAGTSAHLTVGPAIDPKAMRELVPIALVATQATLLANRTEHPAKSLDDFINLAKQKSGQMTVGTTGVQSIPYFDLELLEQASGTRYSHVPIANSSEGMANVLGGHIDAWFGTVSITQNLMKAGRIRGLATCNPTRLADFPDIPTFAEKGYPDVNLNLYMIIYGPKGITPEMIKVWEDAFTTVMKKPAIISALNNVNFEVNVVLGSEKISKMLATERERLTAIAKAKGIKP
jgi:tripartite-type tricarboxylate transporter receptor subunit TctC